MDDSAQPPSIVEFVTGSREKRSNKDLNGDGSAQAEPVTPAQGKRGGDFLRSYLPLSYVIDGVLPSGYLYGLTAKPGGGKTAFLIAASLAVITGQKSILGFAVREGRVAYIAKENPFDIKMKIAVNCFVHNVDWASLDAGLFVFDGRDETPEAIAAALILDAKANGDFALVCYDTFQAGFAATGAGAFNENEDVLRFLLRLRPLTEVPGSQVSSWRSIQPRPPARIN